VNTDKILGMIVNLMITGIFLLVGWNAYTTNQLTSSHATLAKAVEQLANTVDRFTSRDYMEKAEIQSFVETTMRLNAPWVTERDEVRSTTTRHEEKLKHHNRRLGRLESFHLLEREQ